jgi:hypothetical protein
VGLLTDFFVAAPELVSEDRFQQGPTGSFPTVQAKRLDPLRLAELLEVTRNASVPGPVELLNEFPLVFACPGGESWVVACPLELRDALAGADESILAGYASRWAGYEELKRSRYDAPEVAAVLHDVADMARLAQTRNQLLYLWMCL